MSHENWKVPIFLMITKKSVDLLLFFLMFRHVLTFEFCSCLVCVFHENLKESCLRFLSGICDGGIEAGDILDGECA